MSKPDVSQVTQAEVEALFDKDGELREPGSVVDMPTDDEDDAQEDEDSAEGDDEEQEAEAEEGEEESEAEESESDEDEEAEEEEEAELNWDEVDPQYREAFEAQQAEAAKWKRDYGKLQSKFTKESRALKQDEQTLNELRAQAQVASRWSAILEEYPELQKTLVRELERLKDPLQNAEIPDYLKEDPAFKFVRQTYEPVINALRAEIQGLKQKSGRIDEWDAKEQEAANRKRLDGLLDAAGKEFKSMFQRDWNEDEKTQVLRYMVEKKYYEDGGAAALAVFRSQYAKDLQARQSAKMREKAKKFPPRTKTGNVQRAPSTKKDALTPEEAIAMALAEQGFGK